MRLGVFLPIGEKSLPNCTPETNLFDDAGADDKDLFHPGIRKLDLLQTSEVIDDYDNILDAITTLIKGIQASKWNIKRSEAGRHGNTEKRE